MNVIYKLCTKKSQSAEFLSKSGIEFANEILPIALPIWKMSKADLCVAKCI